MPKKRAAIEISGYTGEWAEEYKRTAAAICEVAGNSVKGIEHIGSTSVPGLAAKPVIDIILGVANFPNDANVIKRPLESIDFEYIRIEDESRMIFRKGEWGNGSHHLHVVVHEGTEWERVIRFRGLLRQNPDAARE